MKVSAIGVNGYSINNLKDLKINKHCVPKPRNITSITFKSGNKNQVIMFGVEVPPYNKSGGVATVMQDFRALRISDSDPIVTNEMKNKFDFYNQKNKILVDPLYNGFVSYDSNGIIKNIEIPKIPTGLPDDSPFKKYEGRYFQTTNDKLQKYETIEDFFKNENLSVANIKDKGVAGNVFILDDVTGADTKLDFGGLGESNIKLFRTQLEVDGKLKNTNDFKIATDLTTSLKSPYEKGGYSTVPGKLSQTWKGVADAKAAKAFVEFMPKICEISNIDPATIILNDSQAGYTTEYMAQKVVSGNEFWKGKKAVFIGHNLGDGYVQRTSYMNMFMNIADKELRNAIYNDENYIEAAKEGGEAVEKFFKELLPKEMLDGQGQVSPFRNSLYWADKGLVSKIIPVSEMYADSIATDPEFAPGIYEYAKDLSQRGIFEGIVNAFENVEFDPTSSAGVPGYYKKTYEIDVNGKKVKLEPLSAFNGEKIKEGAVDTKYVREIKRQNKVKVLQRFDKDVLYALSKLTDVKGHENDYNEVILGLGKKDAKVYGHIKKDIIQEAQKANSKVRMLAAWGRSDAQKAMDSVLKSYIDYIKEYGKQDKYSVLFVGGPHADESEKCINLIKQYEKDPDIAGRVVFIDGFLPNKPFASAADFTVFPSRFAPCELTDLESTKMFASPIVTNIQGLAQKNFDASFEGEADKVTGYKTKHSYTIHLDEIKNLLDKEDNEELSKAVKKFRNGIKDNIHGKKVTEEMIDKLIMTDGSLNYKYNFEVLRPYKDKIIERELTQCYKRALIDDNGKPVQDKMLQNLRIMKTDWENNGFLKKDGISSAAKYRQAFQTDPKTIKKEDTLLFKLRENCSEILKNYHKHGDKIGNNGTFGAKVSQFFKSKGGKWTIAGIGVAALGGLGYYGNQEGWFKTKDNAGKQPIITKEPKEEQKHLSAVV